MTVTLEKIERELKVPREQLLREGIRRYLEFELRSLSVEVLGIRAKYGVRSFNELWRKLEKGEVSESECFEDLTRLEYLELRADKVRKILQEHLRT